MKTNNTKLRETVILLYEGVVVMCITPNQACKSFMKLLDHATTKAREDERKKIMKWAEKKVGLKYAKTDFIYNYIRFLTQDK